MGNQQRSSEQENVQRLSRKGVGIQAIGIPKWWAPRWGEDIVRSRTKVRAANAETRVASGEYVTKIINEGGNGLGQSGIYRYYNTETGKSYVGRAKDLRHRHVEHINLLRKGLEPCTKLNRAWQKYGADKFEYEILCYCDEASLNDLEKAYIDFYDSFNNGYNCNQGGSGNSGFRHTDETKKKIGDALRDIPKSESTRLKMSEVQKGKSLTDEHRAALSAAWTNDRKEAFSASRSGVNNPNYNRRGANSCNHTPVIASSGEFFYTVSEAAHWCGISNASNISSCCNGRRAHSGKHPITGESLSWRKASPEEIELATTS